MTINKEANFYTFRDFSFRRDADEICPLLDYYAALNGNPLRTFRENAWFPTSRVE
jgi:hypothetical protein